MADNSEALLISALVRTGEYQVLAAQGISSMQFHTHRDEMKWLEHYVQRNGKMPSKRAFKVAWPDFRLEKVTDTEHWCGEVRESHKRQALVDTMDSILEMVDTGDYDAAIEFMQTSALDINRVSAGAAPDFDLFGDWEEVYESVRQRVLRARDTGLAGIPTGFTTLDDVTGGIQPGWLAIIAARLGEGKTWTGIKMAYSAAVAGHRVTYFSLEQSRLQIAMRLHAFASREMTRAGKAFNPQDLTRGVGIDLMAYRRFLQDLAKQKGSGDLYINDTSRGLVTPSQIAAAIQVKQPEIVFIDYLTLLGSTGKEWQAVAQLSGELQSIAQRFQIPIVAMSQVNRLGSGKNPPGAEHLSQADAIGQDADLVLTMAKQTDRVTRMKIAKFRHGSAAGAKWYALFSPGTGEYHEISSEEARQVMDEDLEDDD